MNNVTLFSCLIAGLALRTTSAMAKEIETKKQFLEQIAGRKLVQEDSWVILSADGKVSGQGPAKGEIAGDWVWNGKYYCRDITIDGVTFPHDCQTVTKQGDIVTFTHNKGDGISISWTVE